MSRRRVAAAVGAGVVMAAMLPATSANAATIRCGDTVTTNVVLTRNLTCAGDGLIVGADGLTIDLNGYTLSGSGVGTGISGGDNASVTVLNGTIRNFDIGVAHLSGSSLIGLKVLGNDWGTDWTYIFVSGSTFRNNGVAVGRGQATVTGSTFISNGVALNGTSLGNPYRVDSSTFRDNTTAITCYDNDTVVTNSRFDNNTQSIHSTLLCGLKVQDSTFSGGEVAIQLGHQMGFTLDVQRNTFSGAKVGMEIAGDFAAGDGYVIADNVFRDNGASGLYLHVTNISTGNRLRVSGNTFRNNGFWHDPYIAPSGNVLNAGVWANTGTFTANRAVFNGGYGIEGYGVIDGGGNIAKANGNPDQCLGVICTN